MAKPITVILVGATLALSVAGTVALAERGAGHGGDRGYERHQRGGGGGHHGGGHRRGGGIKMIMETFDTDGDGSLTQEELDAARADQLAKFDADANGTLSLKEYEALWLDVMRERMVDQFQNHDDDGDGIVTAEEFGERFEGFVDRADRNGDGVLNADDMRRRGNRGPRAEEGEAPSE